MYKRVQVNVIYETVLLIKRFHAISAIWDGPLLLIFTNVYLNDWFFHVTMIDDGTRRFPVCFPDFISVKYIMEKVQASKSGWVFEYFPSHDTNHLGVATNVKNWQEIWIYRVNKRGHKMHGQNDGLVERDWNLYCVIGKLMGLLKRFEDRWRRGKVRQDLMIWEVVSLGVNGWFVCWAWKILQLIV